MVTTGIKKGVYILKFSNLSCARRPHALALLLLYLLYPNNRDRRYSIVVR